MVQWLELMRKYGPLFKQALPMILEIIAIFRQPPTVGASESFVNEAKSNGLTDEEANALANALK